MRFLSSFAILIIAFSTPSIAQTSVSFAARDTRTTVLEPGGPPVIVSFTADPSPGGGDVFHCIVAAPGASVVLVTPAGNEISDGNAASQGYAYSAFEALTNRAYANGPASIPGYHTFIELPAAAPPGEYRVKALPGTIASKAGVMAFYNSSSNVRVALAPGKSSLAVNTEVSFTSMVFEANNPLAGATVTLRLRALDDPSAPVDPDIDLPDSNILDATVGDGYYMGLWTPKKPGRYTASVKVTGVSGAGTPYSRTAAAEVTVLPEYALFESIGDSAIDDDGDGLPDRIALAAWLKVTQKGNYLMAFVLHSGENQLISKSRFNLDAGPARVEGNIGFSDLVAFGANGPYTITDLRLFYMDDPSYPTADERPDPVPTGAYLVPGIQAAKPLTLAPSSLGFGDVETGAEKALEVTLTNAAAYAFTEMVVKVTNGVFTVVSPVNPVTVDANGTLKLSVRFKPTTVGAQTGTLTVAGLTVNLTGAGVTATAANPSPSLVSFSPDSAPAGGAAFTLSVTGSNFVRTSVVRWAGNARTTTYISPTSLTAAITSADIASAGTASVTVFNPAPGGGTSLGRAFTITAAGAAVAVIDVTPISLAFGDVTVGQSKDLPLTVRNTGTAALSVTAVTSSNSQFTLPGLVLPLNVAAGASVNFTVRFTPTAAGALSANLTMASNAPARPSVAVAAGGSGVAASGGGAVRTLVLAVDDGTFESNVGQPAGVPNVVFVNRLTPPSYPAKLTRVQIHFGNASDELAAGHPVTIVVAQNPGGTPTINNLAFQRVDVAVGTRGGFNSLTLATPLTITQGDFVVGFATRNPVGFYPMAADTTPPLRQRSYISLDGVGFTLIDTLGKDLEGNFAIRAVVEAP